MSLKRSLLRSLVVITSMALTVLMTAQITGCSEFQILNTVAYHGESTRTVDLAYGPDPRQKLDVYRPKNAATHARVVIFFYGGEWISGSKTDYRFVAEALTQRGFVVVLPDYRVYPAVTFPGFVQDGAAAIRWTHEHIAAYGGDPNRLYLMGHSAGSHIAALLTLDAHYLQAVGLDRCAIRATATLSGPYDFTPNPWDRPVFNQPTNATAIDPQIEPITFVDGYEPPMMLVQGLKDKIVSPSNAEHLATRIRQAGGEVKYITYPDRAHASVVVALAAPFQGLAPVLDDVTTFFEGH